MVLIVDIEIYFSWFRSLALKGVLYCVVFLKSIFHGVCFGIKGVFYKVDHWDYKMC